MNSTKDIAAFEELLGNIDTLLFADLAEAEKTAEAAESLANDLGTPWSVRLQLKLVTCKARQGKLNEAELLARKTLDETRHCGDYSLTAGCINLLAGILINKGAFAEALSLLTENLDQVTAAGIDTELGKILNNIGVAYERMGDLPKAMEYYLRSLEHKENRSDTRGIAYTSHNIGILNYLLKNLTEAEQWNSKALALFDELNDLRGRAPALNICGLILREQGNKEESREIHQQALAFARNSGDLREIAESLMYLATIERESGQFQKAKEMLVEAQSSCLSHSDRHLEIEMLIDLAKTQLNLKEFDEGYSTLRQAEALAEEINARTLLRNIYKVQAEYAAENDDFSDAYHNLLRFIELDESLRGAEVEQRIRAITIPLELRAAKAEAEINRLKAAEMERLSLVDTLSGLGNRRKLTGQLDLLAANGRAYTLALIDADHFKSVNDRFSHAIGDRVIAELSVLFSRDALDCEAFRYGGEEFVLLFPGKRTEEALDDCEALRREVEGHDWSRLARELTLTISIGIASSNEAPAVEAVLNLADQRLYQAKAEGRNRIIAG